ncbi:MAG: hypothetical protein ABW321_13230 [Polyangiales bacterium]
MHATARGCRRRLARVSAIALYALLWGACTGLGERGEVAVAIGADEAVRTKVEEVVALVELQARDGSWSQVAMRRLEVDASSEWPFRLIATAGDRRALAGTYQLKATARDRQGAVVAQARTIRDFAEDAAQLALGLHFEAACMFRDPPCGAGTTCHEAACIDAREIIEPPHTAAADGGSELGPEPPATPPTPDAELPCDVVDARSCGGNAARLPLLCDGTAWRSQPLCPDNERCATAAGPDQGHCLPVIAECEGRQHDATFCRDAQMLACKDLVTLEPRPCDAHMLCLTTVDGASCECDAGYVPDAAGGCSEATECGPDRGGCDAHTQCMMRDGKRVCTACPDGYTGTGEAGCKPVLVTLDADSGTPMPSLGINERSYRLRVPLLVQRVTLTLAGPPLSRIEVNGRRLGGDTWQSDVLALGDNPAQIAVIADAGATTTYDLIIERAGEQTAVVKAPEPGDNDMLGISLAIAGDTLVTGAIYEDGSASSVDGDVDNSAPDSGAAYVYQRGADGWHPAAYLKADDTTRNSYFGISAAIAGDTIVVGSTRDEPFSPTTTPKRSGAVYVFTPEQSSWKLRQRVEPSTGNPRDLFGYHVAIDGDTLVVGAKGDGDSGAAYVFTRSGGVFREVQKLKPTRRGTDFGCFVALSGDTLAVGAQTDDLAARSGGAVYVFGKRGDRWEELQQLTPDDAQDTAGFGYGIALHGERMAIGAPRITSLIALTPVSAGEAFVFERSNGRWTQTKRLQSPSPRSSDHFGAAVALNERALVVGAVGDQSSGAGIGADPTPDGLSFAGAAHMFVKAGADWRATAYIKPGEPRADAWFGFAAALDGDDLVITAAFDSGGAPGVNGTGPSGPRSSGSAFIFH